MSIPFNLIPSNERAPLFFAEFDPRFANTSQASQRTLLIGQVTPAGTYTPNTPVRVISAADPVSGGGFGSVLAGMGATYRLNDTSGEVWALPIADAGTGAVAATGTLTVTSAATAAGTIALYVAGILVPVAVSAADSVTTIAANIAAAINASTGQLNPAMAACGLPITATAATGVVTVTARNAGLVGNDIDLRLNYLGTSAGQVMPAGVAITIVPMSGGATNPSIAAALAALADKSFDFIVTSLTDATTLSAIQTFLSDASGRWSPMQQVYGHAFSAVRGTAGTLATLGAGRNDQHLTIVGFNDSPSTAWAWAAGFTGAYAVSARNDPGVPAQYLQVAGILAPPIASRFPMAIRNSTLLYSGISTWIVDATGTVNIEKLITTYVTNAQGNPDNSYLAIETMFVLMFVVRFMRTRVQSKFARMKLANDGTAILPQSNVVTPSTIRAEIIAAYRELEAMGEVQNSSAFSANLVVEKDATNPNRVNVLWPGTLIDQLNVFAMLVQFRLN